MNLLLSILVGFALAYLYEKIAIKISRGKPLIVFGWRLHHSLYGIVFMLLFVLTQNIVALGLGIGIITQHTLTDGFRFLSREVAK